MDFITVVSLTIFVATVGTIVMALVSYGAFKLREWRKPKTQQTTSQALDAGKRRGPDEYLFFKKYVPPPEEPLERDA